MEYPGRCEGESMSEYISHQHPISPPNCWTREYPVNKHISQTYKKIYVCPPSELDEGTGVVCGAGSGAGVPAAGGSVSTVGEGSEADSGDDVADAGASVATLSVGAVTGALVAGAGVPGAAVDAGTGAAAPARCQVGWHWRGFPKKARDELNQFVHEPQQKIPDILSGNLKRHNHDMSNPRWGALGGLAKQFKLSQFVLRVQVFRGTGFPRLETSSSCNNDVVSHTRSSRSRQ